VVVTKKMGSKDRRMTHEKALNYQKTHNIKNLVKVLLSIEARNLEEDGWRFLKVIKGDESISLEEKDGNEYTTLSIPNEWKDIALYSRKKVQFY
jgi:hypothetical protein